MNAQDKLDYAFGQLEGPPRERAEREIAADPALAESLDRLRRAIDRLADDGETYPPPAGLAERTMALVNERRKRRRTLLDYVPVAVPFRWADVGVAAGILLASLLTLLPAVHRTRERMATAACGFNLQQLGVGLTQYATRYGVFPYAPSDHPNAATGTFAAVLHDAGLLPNLAVLDCPCNGPCHHDGPLPNTETLAQLHLKDPARYRASLVWDYAYHAGFRHRETNGHPGPVPVRLLARLPMLADEPAHDTVHIFEGNSPNHGGRGQNVLFTDGHVGWLNTRRVGPHDPDLFLNDNHQPAPGVDIHDAVLVPSLFPFNGW